MVHRGGGSSDAPTHQARPINELRDPNSFAPPPRRTATGLAPAPPPSTAKRSVVPAPSHYHDPRAPGAPKLEKQSVDPALLEWKAQHGQEQQQEQEEQAPRGPYRVDTSGLSTDHLPPPPGRRDGANGKPPALTAPPTYNSATGSGQRSVPAPPPRASPASKEPSLPPRLPARTNSTATSASENSDVGQGQMNTGAVNRLGAAGVSVPGLGIGGKPASPSPPPPPPRTGSGGNSSAGTPVNELQNRFSKLRTTQTADTAQEPPAQGTTWAQKQAAFKTASNFNKDPSSVSLSDAKSAAGTANNFRQRHGEQVASGVQGANNLNQKYGVTNRLGAFAASQQRQQPHQEQGVEPAKTASPAPPVASAASGLAGKKKPPPPPPKKKPGLGGAPAPAPAPANDEPPPIPMSTRPTF